MATPTVSPSPSTEALIAASLDGDLEAFSDLFARYHSALLAKAIDVLRDRREAEDVVQEAFLRAWAALPRFERERPVWPWLATIVHRLAMDVGRKRARVIFADVHIHDEDTADEDPDDEAPVNMGGADFTFEEVCVRETRNLLARAIHALPPRQQRTLMLHELEGWNYSDIAAAEAISVSSVKSLLFRARSRLREAYASAGTLGILLIPVHGLRRARDRVAARARVGMSAHLEGIASISAGQFASSIAALAIAITSLSPAGAAPTHEVRAVAAGLPADDEAGASTRSDGPTTRPSPDATADLIADIADPNQDVSRPEQAHIRSFSSSGDGTVFAVGVTHCRAGLCPPVLFRSDDAGGSWLRLVAEGFRGETVLLPPGFGRTDERIFAMGAAGLQVSDDDGRSFRSVVPAGGNMVLGSAAISPAFDRSDPRILIGGQTLMEYRDDLEVVGPALSTALPGPLEPAFAPAFPRDDRIVVGGMESDPTTGQLVPGVMVCREAVCSRTALSGYPKSPKIRLAPDFERSNRIIAFTPTDVFMSTDGGTSFELLRNAFPGHAVTDVAISMAGIIVAETPLAETKESRAALWLASKPWDSWRSVRATLLLDGVMSLTDDGRHLLAAPSSGGVACSPDGGFSWQRRC